MKTSETKHSDVKPSEKFARDLHDTMCKHMGPAFEREWDALSEQYRNALIATVEELITMADEE